MKVRYKAIYEGLMAPAYARKGDAGLDLRASCDAVIQPGHRAMVPCGFAIEIPQGYCGLVIPRSGLAARHGISVVNAPGLIDSGYRGEICVILLNTDPVNEFKVSRGDRIAQMVIMAYPEVQLELVDELEASQRDSAGFGSSGLE